MGCYRIGVNLSVDTEVAENVSFPSFLQAALSAIGKLTFSATSNLGVITRLVSILSSEAVIVSRTPLPS
jgi:hypothetical protein